LKNKAKINQVCIKLVIVQDDSVCRSGPHMIPITQKTRWGGCTLIWGALYEVFSSHLWSKESTVCVKIQRTPPEKELAILNRCLNRDCVNSSVPYFLIAEKLRNFNRKF